MVFDRPAGHERSRDLSFDSWPGLQINTKAGWQCRRRGRLATALQRHTLRACMARSGTDSSTQFRLLGNGRMGQFPPGLGSTDVVRSFVHLSLLAHPSSSVVAAAAAPPFTATGEFYLLATRSRVGVRRMGQHVRSDS